MAEVAKKLGVGIPEEHTRRHSLISCRNNIREEFEFGDFVFRDKDRQEFGRAANLSELQECIRTIPDDVLIYNTSRNMLSKWFFARGLFTLANQFRKVHENHFQSTAELRDYVSQQIHDYHALNGRGIIAHFDKNSYGKYIWFSRTGEGSLGGKARGLAFLNTLIARYRLTNRYEGVKISTPRTLVIATDHFDKFILDNDLQYVIDGDVSDEEILSEFVSSRLPEELVDELKVFLKTVDTPLAVRSSSKLEDSNYQPFAGGLLHLHDSPDRKQGPDAEDAAQSHQERVCFGLLQRQQDLYPHHGKSSERGEDGSHHPEHLRKSVTANSTTRCSPVSHVPSTSTRSAREKPEDGVVNLAFGLGKTVVDGGNTLRFITEISKAHIAVVGHEDSLVRHAEDHVRP